MNKEDKSLELTTYIKGLNNFVYCDEQKPYNHMGATLTDVMFQAGVNWHTSVEPRINKIKTYENAATINGLQTFFNKVKAEDFFNWKGRKTLNFLSIIEFLDKQFVNTENDLKRWLLLPGSLEKLKNQPGFGNKTVDYLQIVVGFPNVAVDRHIVTMLENAGIQTEKYTETKEIVMGAAKILNVNPSVLDHSIWNYISGSDDSSKNGTREIQEQRNSESRVGKNNVELQSSLEKELLFWFNVLSRDDQNRLIYLAKSFFESKKIKKTFRLWLIRVFK